MQAEREILGYAEVADFLSRTGLAEPESGKEIAVAVRNLSRRNRNLAVEIRGEAVFFLKQGLDFDGRATVSHEAEVYRQLLSTDSELVQYVPRFYTYDQSSGVLVIENLPGAVDLNTHHTRSGRFSAKIGRSIGDALGILHGMPTDRVKLVHPRATPWILSIHKPRLEIFRQASAAGLELIGLVQSSPQFGRLLDQLRSGWGAGAVIHQDLKWENIVIFRPVGSRSTGLKIVDWESVCLGDPCWDIGSVFGQYLSFWLYSIRLTGNHSLEDLPQLARYPLQRMHSALRACWEAYASRRALRGALRRSTLLRAVSYAGVALVAVAYASAGVSNYLDRTLILHLQLAVNMLGRPRQAAIQLLGFASEAE